MESMTPSEIAFKAADYITEHGWCRYTLMDEEGRVCLEGAVRMAAYEQVIPKFPGVNYIFEGNVRILWDTLFALIQQDHPDTERQYWGPISFNDELADSAEDVILLLKRVGTILQENNL